MHDQTNLETEAGIVLSDGDLKSIGERLRDLRGKAKLTQGDIAKGSGEHQSIISDVERGYRKPSINLLVWAARRFQTTVDFLLFGDGPERVRGSICIGEQSVKVFRGVGDGQGLQTSLEEIGSFCIPEKFFTPSTIALEVQSKGNEPTICVGAYAGIDEGDKTIYSGEFYLFKLREGYSLARAFAARDSILLRKENSNHPEIQLPLDRITPETIVGRVKWVFQSV